MMDRSSNKSIGSRIRITFTIIIIIMSICFVYSNIMKNRIIDEYNQSMKINIDISDLSLEFNNMWVHFDYYMRVKDAEVYKKLLVSEIKIESIIQDITPFVNSDKDSSIYFRNLNNMYDWFKGQTHLIIARNELNLETYEQYMKMRTMNNYLSSHSRSLSASYLQFSDSYYSEILDKFKLLDTNLYILLILTIFISIIIIKIVNDDILGTLNKLSISVKNLSDANWDIPDIEEDSYKELDNLTNTFNHMKNSIKIYINELNEKSEIESNYQKEKINNIEKDKIIRETQLKALKMQINPHFLFNNLNTVSRMAMFEGATQTVELIDAVSKILRFNLLNRDNLIKLEDEIENVRAYILIQKIKYEDRITFKFDIEDELSTLHLPPMIIQLLVENAINHGFSGTYNKGIINISVKKEEQYGLITINDNGKGIIAGDLYKLKKGEELNKKGRMSTGLGIININKRLELYYNRCDLLTIESEVGLGTTVNILIPIEESEKIAKDTNS